MNRWNESFPDDNIYSQNMGSTDRYPSAHTYNNGSRSGAHTRFSMTVDRSIQLIAPIAFTSAAIGAYIAICYVFYVQPYEVYRAANPNATFLESVKQAYGDRLSAFVKVLATLFVGVSVILGLVQIYLVGRE